MYLTYICYIINKYIGITKMMWFIDGDKSAVDFVNSRGSEGLKTWAKRSKLLLLLFFLIAFELCVEFCLRSLSEWSGACSNVWCAAPPRWRSRGTSMGAHRSCVATATLGVAIPGVPGVPGHDKRRFLPAGRRQTPRTMYFYRFTIRKISKWILRIKQKVL